VLELVEAKSPIDDAPDSPIDPLHEPLGYTFNKVIEELVPPVAQGLGKPFQVSNSTHFSSQCPRLQETSSPVSILDPFAHSAEFFLEQVD